MCCDAGGAGVYGAQERDDYTADDVEQYFNYMGMLADEVSLHADHTPEKNSASTNLLCRFAPLSLLGGVRGACHFASKQASQIGACSLDAGLV